MHMCISCGSKKPGTKECTQCGSVYMEIKTGKINLQSDSARKGECWGKGGSGGMGSQIESLWDNSSGCNLETSCFSVCILHLNFFLIFKIFIKNNNKNRSADVAASPACGLQGAQPPHELRWSSSVWSLAGQASWKFQGCLKSCRCSERTRERTPTSQGTAGPPSPSAALS